MDALADTPDALEQLLVEELTRADAAWDTRPRPAHYAAIAVNDETSWRVTARGGNAELTPPAMQRVLDIDLRVGTPELDSTHEIRGWSSLASDSRSLRMIPYDGPPFAVRHAVARALDQAYRSHAERIVLVEANQQVKIEETRQAPDFEVRTAVVARDAVTSPHFAPDGWLETARTLSTALERAPGVTASHINVQAKHRRQTFVDTEGTRLRHATELLIVHLEVRSIAADGDEIEVYRSKSVRAPGAPPSPDVLAAWTQEMLIELAARREAPRGTPYSGPVLLGGRAAGVFFHEVFGHRVEGHRQKSEDDAQTFADAIGTALLPASFDVVDDPTLRALAGEDLNGHYGFDDEGVRAERVTLVEDGVFRGFLMSRSPLPQLRHSNGHGRRQPGKAPVSRMGSLIVRSERMLPAAELRARLIDEARRQNLPYAMVVDEITGGFTTIDRWNPNAFKLHTDQAWRVYVDGRPDERVRGIDLVGTPLRAFANVIAAGGAVEVFNGMCGAESGWVPVSAAAPSVLLRAGEFQLESKEQDRPPLLEKPGTTAPATPPVKL